MLKPWHKALNNQLQCSFGQNAVSAAFQILNVVTLSILGVETSFTDLFTNYPDKDCGGNDIDRFLGLSLAECKQKCIDTENCVSINVKVGADECWTKHTCDAFTDDPSSNTWTYTRPGQYRYIVLSCFMYLHM